MISFSLYVYYLFIDQVHTIINVWLITKKVIISCFNLIISKIQYTRCDTFFLDLFEHLKLKFLQKPKIVIP